jgi:hypothetical protein
LGEPPKKGAGGRSLLAVGYAYEDLDDSQFERLVVQSSRKLFGAVSFVARSSTNVAMH